MAEREFHRFLGEALRLLELEAPRHFELVRDKLIRLSVGIAIEGSPGVSVVFDAPPFIRLGAEPSCAVHASTDQITLDALLGGALSIEQAVLQDRLLLRGELQAVLAFFDALQTWIHGAVRCASFTALYDCYVPATAIVTR